MSSPLEPGSLLAGKYRVERQLGEGGMGVVVAATDVQLERRVAVKFLLPEYAVHEEAAKRFLREARAAVKIQSEHVARVIDVGTLESGAPYMVMEYLEGADLSGVLEQRGPLPVEEAVAHVLEACDAIAEAHSYGIVHRDLKPANLFLARQSDGSSRIKVLDFGISKAMMTTSSGVDHSLTRTSTLMGSPLYMSPEQMKSAKNVDPRTDIWALGVILHELLSGAPPFSAESIPELSAKVLLEEPPSLTAARPDVPAALEAIVRHTLAKDPNDRPATVADLAMALISYAPRCSRNVERITRVLKVAGLTSSQFDPSEVRLSASGATLPNAQTAAAWTDSKIAPVARRGATPLWIGLGVVGAGAMAAAVFFFGGSPEAPAVEPSAAAALSEPAPELAGPSEPAVAKMPSFEPAQSASVAPPAPSAAPPASTQAAEPTEMPSRPAPKPVVRRPIVKKAPAAEKPATAPPPEPKKASSDVSAFGSRK